MKLILFATMMLHVYILSAQNHLPAMDLGSENQTVGKSDYSSAKESLMKSLGVEDTAYGKIIVLNHDTTPVRIYYSKVSTLAKMQSFVVAEDSLGHVNFYNPSNIAGYILYYYTGDTLDFVSVENELAIVSVLKNDRIVLNPDKSQERYVMGNKIFLRRVVNGSCQLFRYMAGTGKGVISRPGVGGNSGAFSDGPYIHEGDAEPSGGYANTTVQSKFQYCIRKDGKRFVELKRNHVADAFADCKDVADMADTDILKDIDKLKRLVILYNKWRDAFSANQRY